MCVMPSPVPSIETKRSICPFMPSLKRYFTPRRSPSPSSPTVPTNVMLPGVCSLAWFIACTTASSTASPRQSSPMPGPRSMVPSRFTRTSVPSGNTVSRCAVNTSRGRGCSARTIAEHVAFLVDADVLQAGLAKHPRVDLGALRFLERRRLDLAQPHLVFDRLRLGGANHVDRGFHGGARSSASRRCWRHPVAPAAVRGAPASATAARRIKKERKSVMAEKYMRRTAGAWLSKISVARIPKAESSLNVTAARWAELRVFSDEQPLFRRQLPESAIPKWYQVCSCLPNCSLFVVFPVGGKHMSLKKAISWCCGAGRVAGGWQPGHGAGFSRPNQRHGHRQHRRGAARRHRHGDEPGVDSAAGAGHRRRRRLPLHRAAARASTRSTFELPASRASSAKAFASSSTRR